MLVQANSSYPFSNSYLSASYEPEKTDASTQLEELKQEYNSIFQELNPSERRLYDSLIHSENFLGARGVVTVGFMRAAGIYKDGDRNALSGQSLFSDLSRLNPPSSPKDRAAIMALQNHLIDNSPPQMIDPTLKGNLIDLKI